MKNKFFTDSSDGYTDVRDEKAARMNPNFPLTLRELLQNVPWSEMLTNVNLKLTKVQGTGDRGVLLEILDNDYGCTYVDFVASLLSTNTKDGFKVEKRKANKFGQGIQQLVTKSSTNKVIVEMKKDGKAWRVTINADANRTRKVFENIKDSKIKTDSGFYIQIPLEITNKSWKINSPEVMVEEFYSIIRQDCHFNLGRVKFNLELVGFDTAFVESFKDLDCIQRRNGVYVTDDLSTVTMHAPHIEDKPQIYDFMGGKIRLLKIELGKRVGLQEASSRLGMNDEEYNKLYFLAEYGDKPIALFRCSRTGLLFPTIVPLRNGSTGQINLNHLTVICDIDIQDECWGVDQTKENIMTPTMMDYLKTKLQYLAEGFYPSESYKEFAYQSWLFDTYTEGDDLAAERLRHDSGIGFLEDMSLNERLKYVFKEDTNGASRYDFSLLDKDTVKMPVEVKPKAFKVNEFLQVLKYYMQESSERVTMLGLDVGNEKISVLNNQVDRWKRGKMSDLAKWEYLDGRKYGYNKIIEREYINRVRDAIGV